MSWLIRLHFTDVEQVLLVGVEPKQGFVLVPLQDLQGIILNDLLLVNSRKYAF